MRNLLLGTFTVGILAMGAPAADWPQWLGPNRDGSSSEKIAPWKGDLKPAWQKPMAEGNSSPVVADGLVFMHSKVKDKDVEMVQAFDAKSGDLKWEKTYDKTPFKPFYGEGPRSTPCVHKGVVFTFGNTGTLAAWKATDGASLWQKDVLKEFKESNLFFGIACSPIVVDDKVLVMIGKKGKSKGGDGPSTGVAAFNVSDGSLAWKGGDDPASYSSPIIFGEGAKRQIVFLTGSNVMSLAPDGKVLWKHEFVDKLFESSTTPVKVGDLIIASSVTKGSVALKLTEKDGKPAVEEAWKNPALTCYFSTPVPAGKDHVYMVTGVASITDASITLRCVEVATGKEIWKKEKVGKYHAAILRLADGNLLLHADNGDLMLLAPDTKEYKELARGKVCGNTWAHPAFANGWLYFRDDKELLAYKMAE